MNKHLTIAITLVYLMLLTAFMVINYQIDQDRMDLNAERVNITCERYGCEPIHGDEVIKYEDGSILVPSTGETYCTEGGLCEQDNFSNNNVITNGIKK